MVHLSNMSVISTMVFYSILTFFIGPLITRPLLGNYPDPCVAGFLFGFTISIFLWIKYGRQLAKN